MLQAIQSIKRSKAVGDNDLIFICLTMQERSPEIVIPKLKTLLSLSINELEIHNNWYNSLMTNDPVQDDP